MGSILRMYKKKIQSIELLRVFAAWIVFNQHFLGIYNDRLNQQGEWPITLWSGHFAVAIFFVLSGFCLTNSYYMRSQAIGWKETFAKIGKRYVQFVIPIFIVTSIAFIIFTLGGFVETNTDVFQYNCSYLEVIKDALWGTLFLGHAELDFVLWTMRYEWYASVFIYIFLKLTNGMKNWKIIYRMALYLIAGGVICVLEPTYLCFEAGMILADWYVTCQKKPHPGWLTCVLLVFCAIISGGYPTGEIGGIYGILSRMPGVNFQTMHAAGAVVSVGICLLLEEKKQNWKPGIEKTAHICFEFYLVHAIVLYSFGEWAYRTIHFIILAYICSLAISYVCAQILHEFTKILYQRMRISSQ